MNWIIYHFVSGGAFFTGGSLVVLGAALGFANKHWCRRCAPVSCVIGAVLVAASATPIGYWFYAVLGVVTLAWLLSTNTNRRPTILRRQRLLGLLLIATCIVGVSLELPHHLMPTIQATKNDTIVIFGDSITAGIGEESETWPQILARERSLVIRDYSRPGATVATTLKQISGMTIPDGIVILEIGGNDLLGSTSVAQFRRDLKAVVEQLSTPSRQIVMFELPLPPLSNAFGRVQRELAKEFHVKLIPKCVFARVLTEKNATLDSIHLSQKGHRRMADAVWQIIGPALGAEPTD